MEPVLIIAEAGVNHNGSIALAEKLIDAAFNAGVDIVKFQTFKASQLVTQNASKASYQLTTTSAEESQYEMLKKLELNVEMHQHLIEYCQRKPIQFLSTPFDVESIDLLKRFGINIGKIPSGEITNLPYLVYMAKNFDRIILSTGMCTLREVKEALDVLLINGVKKENITVLHCNTEYPTPMKDVHLHAMLTLKNSLGVEIGYSDHTLGIEIPIAATALGARVIEKHFTLDKSMEGPDHKASLEPKELKEMVNAIRNIELALGNADKTPSSSELKNIVIARKSIHLKHDVSKDHILSADDLIMKRPGDGISPMVWEKVIGQKTNRPLSADTKLKWEDLQ
ncbi:MAG: N-acetylneuraminate synthase [Cytophagaceae bacterium]|jgi:N-acetylneuraminate synthase|nr:N-acetylneuraminate synthase [Cytophagaceae bacterium]